MSTSSSNDRVSQLDAARRRLGWLEVETHRLRAELARLEAQGEDAAAAELEAKLLRRDELAPFELKSFEPGHDDSRRFSSRESLSIDSEPATVEQSFRLDSRHSFGPDPNPTPELDFTENFISAKVVAEKQATNNKKGQRKSLLFGMPAWTLSLAAHALILFLFGAASFATLTADPPYMLANSIDGDDDFVDDMAEIDLDQIDLEELDLETTDFELESPELDDFELSDFESPLESTDLSPGFADALPSDIGSLMAGASGGEGDSSAIGGKGKGSGSSGGSMGGAQFFGAKSRGDRFVFVVDNSGSMKDGRMETTLMELQRTIFSLSPKQSFYVIFYSDQAYPMFFPDSAEEIAPATRENKKRLAKWLPTVEMCVGGRLVEAMELAAELEPNAVFVLSDGDIRSTKTMEFLTEPNDWKFSITTFGMTVKSQKQANTLMAIAAAHGGQFIPVGVSQQAVRMSQLRPIPYHNQAPGPIWGSKVRGWGK